MRRANSSVRSSSSSRGKTLDTMPSRCASSTSMLSPVSSSSFVLRAPNSHGWAKYSSPHMPRRVPTTSANTHVVGGDDQVARPHQHEPGGVHGAVHLGDRDLAQVPPPAACSGSSSATPGASASRRPTRVAAVDLRRSGASRYSSMATFEPMSWPEENIGPVPPRITTRHVVVGLGPQERLVELDEQAAVLRVPRLGAVRAGSARWRRRRGSRTAGTGSRPSALSSRAAGGAEPDASVRRSP